MPEFRDERHAGSPFLSVIPALSPSCDLAAALADGLRSSDAVHIGQAFPRVRIAALQAEAEQAHARGRFAGARMGQARDTDAAVRGDEICWLEARADAPAGAALLADLDALRASLDHALLLGLRSVEAHYAMYGAGTHYARHLDRFSGDTAAAQGGRVVSLVIYLNAAWGPGDGGALRLHEGAGGAHDILPRGGDLVAFLSDRVAHEVLPATRPRWSVAAWLRRDA
jgi:SM-20-related protein